MPVNVARCAFLLCCSLAAGPSVADDDFRCGSSIVRTGMTQAAVLAACGEPATKSVEEVDVRSGNRLVGKTLVSRWTYLMSGVSRVLTFDQEELKSID